MLGGGKHERRVLQVHEDHVGAARLEHAHALDHSIRETVGVAAPRHVIGAELPDDEVGAIGEDIALEARHAARDRLADVAAIDHLGACVRAQSRKFAPHHLGISRARTQDPESGRGGGSNGDDAQRIAGFEPRRGTRQRRA
jgi:hypothetical protein